MKKCPKCGTDLKLKVIGSIEIDECESCKGIWLDKGELREAKDLADPNLNWLDFEIWKHPEKFNSKQSDIQCPTCNIPTVGIEYGHTGVNIDYCKNCFRQGHLALLIIAFHWVFFGIITVIP